MKKQKKSSHKALLSIAILALVLITLLTSFYGNTDIYDYEDAAKLFAGKYDAKMRSSHSYLYGFIHTPFVYVSENFLVFKVTSLLSLLLIVYSVYWMSKDPRALWLMLLSPIVWYISPWASPIQLASLLFLWGYYFISKYNEKESIKPLLYSGMLLGLAWAFWDGALFFIPLLGISFMHNKKLSHSIYLGIFIMIGVLPRLILDQALFGFAFFGIARHILASLNLTLYGGFYNQGSLYGIISLIFVIVLLPVYTYLVFTKKTFKENRKTAVFVLLSVLLLIVNSQIRLILIIAPIIILTTHRSLGRKQFITQIAISLVLILIIVNPYIIQTNSEIGEGVILEGQEISYLIVNPGAFTIDNDFTLDQMASDINEIAEEFPSQTFVVGNTFDLYRVLANLYWGPNVDEFVSIEDYNLFLQGENSVFGQELCSNAKIQIRRDICASVYIRKSLADATSYGDISYGISREDTLDLEGFVFVKKYQTLSLFEKLPEE